MKASKTFLFLIMMSLCLVDTQPVKSQSSGTIYIRADGSVDPPTAPIQRDGNTYTLTDNIYDEIDVEKDNIVVDGAGFTLQGTAAYISRGIDLSGRSNVTVENMEIRNFMDGIYLVPSSNSTITRNNITANTGSGIWTAGVSNNITGNYIANNNIGILFEGSHDLIYHNNFINNTKQVEDICWTNPWLPSSANILDDSYPSGGNYWSDYEERYPNATEIDNSGIWNTPYAIDENNQDNYPLMKPVEIPEFPDTTPPTISIVSPENNTYIEPPVHLKFTVSKSTSWIGYSLDGQANVTITGNTTITGLPEGPHSLVVYATDTDGNTGASETIYFTAIPPDPKYDPELFPKWAAWAVAVSVMTVMIVAVAGAILLAYFAKVKKKSRKPNNNKIPTGILVCMHFLQRWDSRGPLFIFTS